MTADDLRFYFLICALFAFALYKVIDIVWRRGYRAGRDQHFGTAVLRRDDSVRQRL